MPKTHKCKARRMWAKQGEVFTTKIRAACSLGLAPAKPVAVLDVSDPDALIEQAAEAIRKCWPGAIMHEVWIKEARAVLASLGIIRQKRLTK